MSETEYLYRYTTLENLAATLKYHTIRLNPLDKMDDLQEQKTKDIKNIGRFIFISSWTAEEKEDIPMWKLYTNMQSGVRIRLPKNPFKRQGTNAKELSAVTGMPLTNDSVEKTDTFLDISKLFKMNVNSAQAFGGDILQEVIYTDDKELLEPQIFYEKGTEKILETGKLGKHKNTYWSFQKEWRYMITFVRFVTSLDPKTTEREMRESFVRMINGTEQLPFRHFDLEIDPKYFAEMEITPSPQMTPGNRIILDTLVERYNPTATIKESELKDLIYV